MIGRESSYVDYMKAAPGFSVWQNFVPTKANFYAIGQIFIVANGQIMKQNQAIWSQKGEKKKATIQSNGKMPQERCRKNC